MTKEEVLEKHLIPMLKRERGNYIELAEMKGRPEWNVMLEAMEEYANIKLNERQNTFKKYVAAEQKAYKVYDKMVDMFNSLKATYEEDNKFLQIMLNLAPEIEKKALELVDQYGLTMALHKSVDIGEQSEEQQLPDSSLVNELTIAAQEVNRLLNFNQKIIPNSPIHQRLNRVLKKFEPKKPFLVTYRYTTGIDTELHTDEVMAENATKACNMVCANHGWKVVWHTVRLKNS